MDRKLKIIVEYDGSAYHGWQRQKSDPTIQGEIEKALAIIGGSPVAVTGSGRTDAGVHALGQCAHFTWKKPLPPQDLQRALNALLPDDIVIAHCHRVPDAFHARYDARGKAYRYRILNRPTAAAIGRQYLWHIRKPLWVPAMTQALDSLVGTHDFKAFEGAGSPRAHTERTIFSAGIREEKDGVMAVDVEGSGFLRFMVRNIVGTLVEVGLGKRSVAQFKDLLVSRDRSLAGATAPARGLCLMRVDYGPAIDEWAD